jgi:hypothetical protein
MWKDELRDKPWRFIGLVVSEIVVFGLAYLIVDRFFPGEEVIYNAILIAAIFTVGVTIMLRGNAIRNRALNVAGFLVFLVGVFVVIYIYEGFAVKISAFAALLVAFAAFGAMEENRRLRKDSIGREERDRKERLVDETGKWLRELEGNVLPMYSEIMSGAKELVSEIGSSPKVLQKAWVERYSIDRNIMEGCKVDGGIKEAEYYKKLAVGLSEELSRLIGVIENDMEQRKEMLIEGLRYPIDISGKEEKPGLIPELIGHADRSLEGLGLSDRDIGNIRLGRNANAIRESIRNALNEVIEVKTSLIEVR